MSGMETVRSWLGMALLGELVMAGTVLVVLAHCASRLLRRSAAANRHLVWALALAALAVWPVLEATLPVWEAGPTVAAPPVVNAPVAQAVAIGPVARTGAAASNVRSSGVSTRRPRAAEQGAQSSALVPPSIRPAAVGGERAAAAPTTEERTPIGVRALPRGLVPWASLLWVTWVGGVVAMVLLLGIGVLARRLTMLEGAVPLDTDPWRSALAAAQRRMGVQRSVRLVMGARARVPVTWGVLRPVVLVPAAAAEWPDWQRRAVLVHELAHVRRGDHLTQTLGWVAVALHWFNPLVWYAHACLRAEAEHACDDLALTSGERPSQYATGLVSIAALLTGRSLGLPGTVAMARRPELGDRVEAILDAERNRSAASRVWVAGAVVVTAFIAIPLAALGPKRAAPVDVTASAAPFDKSGVDRALAADRARVRAERARVRQDRARVRQERAGIRENSGVAEPSHSEAPIPATSDVRAPQVVQACVPRTDGRGMRDVINGRDGRLNVRWDLDDCSVTVRIDEPVDFGPEETHVVSIGPGGRFELAQRGLGPDRELLVVADRNGDPKYTFSRDSDPVEMDEAARLWMADMIPAIYRITGIRARERVARLLEAGGPARVTEEVRQIHSDHVAGQYLSALLGSGELSDAETRQVFEVAGQRIDSDYELGQLLRSAWRPGLSGAARAAFLESARTIDSDHELGQVIQAFLKEAPTATEAVEVLSLAAGIESDHELAQALNTVLARAEASPEVQSAVLEAAAGLESDYELAELLVKLARSAGPAALDSRLFLDLLSGVESGYELARTLSEVLKHPDLEDRGLLEIVGLSANIESDYERAELLSQLIEQHAALSETVADRVVDAAQELSSEYERDRVISLLVRSSR